MFDFSKNYFDLFGLPISFRLEVAALSDNYRELQKLVHPDRYASASEQEQRLALQQAMQVNEAYETLRDPLRRAQYMLKLQGLDAIEDNATTRDTEFLMQQMELREELDALRSHADAIAQLDQLMGRISDLIKEQVAQLAVQLEVASPEQLEAARDSVVKMQFLSKLHRAAELLEEQLEENY